MVDTCTTRERTTRTYMYIYVSIVGSKFQFLTNSLSPHRDHISVPGFVYSAFDISVGGPGADWVKPSLCSTGSI